MLGSNIDLRFVSCSIRLFLFALLSLSNVYSVDTIDAKDLFTFSGNVAFYSLDESSTVSAIPRQDFNITDYIMYENVTEYTPAPCNHLTPININLSPSIQEVLSVTKAMLCYINMVCATNLTKVGGSSETLNRQAIEVIMYRIAYNPVGLRLLKRIINQLSKNENRITFKILDHNFSYRDLEITIPTINFADKKAERRDIKSFCFAKHEDQYVLSEHNRPFYLGLVHELIHLMHDLEGRRNGTSANPLSEAIDDFGGTELWGGSDDLHVIWGVCAIQGREVEYDNVSELTFRISENIPIRMFYESDAPVGNGTTLDKYAFQHFEDYGQMFLDNFGEDNCYIDAIEMIKNILTSLNIDKISIMSL